MEYRQLGNSGLQVSTIGLGTNNFGKALFDTGLDSDASVAVVDQALDVGINMIDTANSYSHGLSEEYIGRAIKGKRDKVILATKVSSRMGEGPNNAGNSRVHIMAEVEASLRRLDTEYIDLYQIHWWDPNTPLEETLRALDDLVSQGKVRYIGSSNFAAWQACEAAWTSKSLGITSFVSVQPRYSMMDRAVEKELVPFCQKYGVGILPYFPLENGFLTGKYRRNQDAPAGTRLASNDRGMFTDENFDILEGLIAFAKARDHTMVDLAFSWLLANKAVSSVIAGATKIEQVVSNSNAAGWNLTDDEVAEVNGILGAN
ncbi:MAG: aldo/keto reductase [SAR202 cluster bacterium]|jgi:aryl-alcohol dehydrogenase-like predicted oxidoreductase|nr:aldo/keto reductase [SAR202 cluster bacterium]MDP6514548.1 aldo/keto reductase [SAR202 cluster bacterium]